MHPLDFSIFTVDIPIGHPKKVFLKLGTRLGVTTILALHSSFHMKKTTISTNTLSALGNALVSTQKFCPPVAGHMSTSISRRAKYLNCGTKHNEKCFHCFQPSELPISRHNSGSVIMKLPKNTYVIRINHNDKCTDMACESHLFILVSTEYAFLLLHLRSYLNSSFF